MITSLDNTKVKNWTKLHNKKYRDEEFLLLNEELVQEANNHGLLKTLIYVGEKPFEVKEAYEVSREVLNKIAKIDNLSYIGIGLKKENKKCYQNRVILLEDLQDAMNVGRIIENAYLFGFDCVVLSENSADIYNEKCLTAASKAFYNVNVYRGNIHEEIAKLKENGFKIYATGLKEHSLELYEVKQEEKMAFILGNEGSGVKEETFKMSDEVVKIDMQSIDSLNVAMAGAICMYRFQK